MLDITEVETIGNIMAEPVKCNARNKATCRYHGEVDHARMRVEDTQEKYDNAVKAYNDADPETRDFDPHLRYGKRQPTAIKSRVNNTKAALRKATTGYDVLPGPYKELKAEVEKLADAPDSDTKRELVDRLERADKMKAGLKRKAVADKKIQKIQNELEAKNQAAFQDLVRTKEEEDKNPDNSWRAGYKKAVSTVMIEDGTIVNGPGMSSYGSYFPATNRDKTDHLKKCGALDVRNIQEDSWDEWNFNSMSSVQTSRQEYKVTADATCNCGHLVKEKLEVSGTFSEITQRVLSF